MIATVLSGTVCSGLGETSDPNKLKMYPAGSVYIEPLNAPHFTRKRGKEVILKGTLIGPFTAQYVNLPGDPRNE